MFLNGRALSLSEQLKRVSVVSDARDMSPTMTVREFLHFHITLTAQKWMYVQR